MSIEPWSAPDLTILSDEEIQRVILSMIESSDEAVEERDIKLAVDWAAKAKLSGMLYDMVQRGQVAIAGMEGVDNPLITVREEVLDKVKDAFLKVFGKIEEED